MESREMQAAPRPDSGYYDDNPGGPDPASPRYRGRAGLPYKSPVLTGFLSTACGLGHIYLGYYQQGFIHAMLFATIITGLATIDVVGVDVILALSLAYLCRAFSSTWRSSSFRNVCEPTSASVRSSIRSDPDRRRSDVLTVFMVALEIRWSGEIAISSRVENENALVTTSR